MTDPEQVQLTDPAVRNLVAKLITGLVRVLGAKITVSVVIERAGKANIITNATDYDKLGITLQSIAQDETTKFHELS